jgi:hypothetical protein
MDWIAAVLRRIVLFTQAGGEVNIIVTGINVGAQPYWDAEATMLMHTRGIHQQGGNWALSPRLEPLANPVDRAKQAHCIGELIGHRVDGLVTAAFQEQLLNRAAFLRVTHPADHVEVKVAVPRAHASDVKGEHLFRSPQSSGQVIGNDLVRDRKSEA